MNEGELHDLLLDADRAAGPAPRATVEGARRAVRRRAVRRAGACVVIAGVAMVAAQWTARAAATAGDRRALAARRAALEAELAHHERRARDLVVAERAGEQREERALARASSGEVSVVERMAAAALVGGEVAAGGDRQAELAACRQVEMRYPSTMAAELARRDVARPGVGR